MKMEKITGKFQFIKDYDRKLDKRYGTGSIRLYDTVITTSVMLSALVFSQYMNAKSVGVVTFLYRYLFIISLLTLSMVCIFNLYDRPPHSIKSWKHTKVFLKIFIYIFIFLFCISASPVLILATVLNYIEKRLHVKFLTKIIDITSINLGLYFIAYLSCLFFYILTHATLWYIVIIIFACLATNAFRQLFYTFSFFSSYRAKYEFLLYSKRALMIVINILAVFLSIISLYISKKFIIFILPVFIFNGFEQLSLLFIQRPNEKRSFVDALYNELINLQDIAYSQITDFSCIKIRIKLHISPYIIENYIKYFQTELSKDRFIKLKKRKKKLNQKLIETLIDCKSLLSKEYDVYQEQKKAAFEKDLANVIENLAQYLTNNI